MRARVVLLSGALALGALAGLSRPEAQPPAKQVADFALKDTAGKTWSLGGLRDKNAIVVIFLGTECPVNNAYLPRLAELHKEYAGEGVQFLGVNANRQDTPKRVAALRLRLAERLPAGGAAAAARGDADRWFGALRQLRGQPEQPRPGAGSALGRADLGRDDGLFRGLRGTALAFSVRAGSVSDGHEDRRSRFRLGRTVPGRLPPGRGKPRLVLSVPGLVQLGAALPVELRLFFVRELLQLDGDFTLCLL